MDLNDGRAAYNNRPIATRLGASAVNERAVGDDKDAPGN
jgi:hypothetical protein